MNDDQQPRTRSALLGDLISEQEGGKGRAVIADNISES
jgi:hypothetical protein